MLFLFPPVKKLSLFYAFCHWTFTRNGTSFNRMKNCFDNVLGIWIKNTYPPHQQSLLNIVILRTLGTFYKYAKEKRYLAEKKFFYDKIMHNFSSFPPAQSDFYLNGKVGLMLLLLQNESTNGRVLGDAEYLIF